MKKLLFLILLISTTLFSQNKQVLYDFADLPQSLLLNPALENTRKFHIGVPLLSGISTQIGSSGLVLTDLFAIDNQTSNDKVANVIHGLSSNDFVTINTQIELINAGFRLNEKTYISGGFYQENDVIFYLPKDVLLFLSEGNDTFLNKSFSASQVAYKLDVIGVLHAGITRKIDEKLTIGGRFKIYSSAVNLESTNNLGTLTTVEGSTNIFRHYFSNVAIEERTSGLIDANNEVFTKPSDYIKRLFLKGNLGVGFDFGINYHFEKQLQFSASILDVGFIKHSKNVKNYQQKGSFVYDGFEYVFDANTNFDFWSAIQKRFNEELPSTENNNSYISWRPAKVNMALKYSFGEKRSEVCYDNSYKDFFTDAIGAQLFTVFRPLQNQFALTFFYQKSLSKKLHTKFTYTFDDYSTSNIGAGLSFQLGKVNFYGMADNILSYQNLSSANALSLQLGINILFD